MKLTNKQPEAPGEVRVGAISNLVNIELYNPPPTAHYVGDFDSNNADLDLTPKEALELGIALINAAFEARR